MPSASEQEPPPCSRLEHALSSSTHCGADGAETLTLVLASFFIVGGLFRTIGSAMVKFPRWGWAVFSGILTLVLGIMLLAQMPISGIWFIGFAIGVKLIFDRVKQLREEYEQSQTKLKHLLARQLREAAAKLDK